MDTDTGELQEKRLTHREEAEKFYRALAGEKVRVEMEAGHERLGKNSLQMTQRGSFRERVTQYLPPNNRSL